MNFPLSKLPARVVKAIYQLGQSCSFLAANERWKREQDTRNYKELTETNVNQFFQQAAVLRISEETLWNIKHMLQAAGWETANERYGYDKDSKKDKAEREKYGHLIERSGEISRELTTEIMNMGLALGWHAANYRANCKEDSAKDKRRADDIAENISYEPGFFGRSAASQFATLCTVCPAFPPLPDLNYVIPVSTQSHHLVDRNGAPVRLHGVNWPCHMDTMLPEGLQHLNIDAIAAKMAQLGFNCVRLTYCDDMFAQHNVMLTARASLERTGLQVYLPKVQHHNPEMMDMLVFDCFKRAVIALQRHNIMVIIDNHTSHAGWFPTEGNGFWGDKYFNPDAWLHGLNVMSQTFRGPAWYSVIGFSLRNELFGDNCKRANLPTWYDNMVKGAATVHGNAPHALVIVGGLTYHSDLEHVRAKPLQDALPDSIRTKLCHEWHWYNDWYNCNSHLEIDCKVGFCCKPGQQSSVPLFLSEFGCNMDGFSADSSDGEYMRHVVDYLEREDVQHGANWALWEFFGDYYIREGQAGKEDSWGLMKPDLRDVRSHAFLGVLHRLMSSRLQVAGRGALPGPPGGFIPLPVAVPPPDPVAMPPPGWATQQF